jgi:putative intracellular protease/amidase
MTTTVVFYATDPMADWEYGYLLAGLAMATKQDPGAFRVLVASEDGSAVTSKGGVRVTPEVSLADVAPAEVAALVLPGADTWFAGHETALDLAERTLAAGGVVAAICGATYGLARAGLLDDRDHTSNARDFLVGAPGYGGAARYREARAVHDRGVITATATAPVDFARAVFAALQVFPEPVIEAWYGLYTTGERRFYDALVGA